MLRSQFSMASFFFFASCFCAAFVMMFSAMSLVAEATEAGDWYLVSIDLGHSETNTIIYQ